MIVMIVCQTLLKRRMEHVTVMKAMEVSTVLIGRESASLCVAAVPDQTNGTVHLASEMLPVIKNLACVSVTKAGPVTTVIVSLDSVRMSVLFSEETMTAQRDHITVNDV